MQWISALLLGLLVLLAGAVLAVVAVEPDLVRIMAGMSGLRWRVLAAWVCGGLLLLAVIGVALASRRRRPLAWIAVACCVLGLLVLQLRQPAYEREPVRYAAGDIELVGELYRPNADDLLPAVVLVHGSAAFPRAMYDRWADFLADAGFAVLLVDKRGVGDSGGEFESENNAARVNLDRLADDVVAGVRFLESRDDIDPRRIGLYGISQAGWVGVLAATRAPEIRFVVFNSGPTVSIAEEDAWSRMRGDGHATATLSMDAAEARIRDVAPRGYDPRPDLANLAIPGFWQFGAQDSSIPAAKSAAVLDGLIAEGKPFAYRIYPSIGHVLLDVHGDGGAIAPIPDETWADLEAWARGQEILR